MGRHEPSKGTGVAGMIEAMGCIAAIALLWLGFGVMAFLDLRR